MFDKSLEQIAKKMFMDLAIKHTGLRIDWKYLNVERRFAWIKEVGETFTECLKYLEKDLSINIQPSKSAASYERGFAAGQAHEAHRLNERINYAKNLIEEQLQKFINTEAVKNADN